MFRSGFISLIGRANVGKSTFLNKVIGKKIAITSNKPQTTRDRIQGILTTEDTQYILLILQGCINHTMLLMKECKIFLFHLVEGLI